MRIFIVGAGLVGVTIVEALHAEHECTVVDLDRNRLGALASRLDVVTVLGNGASRRTLQEAGVQAADLLIACTSRDEANIVSSMFTKILSPQTKTIVRTTNVEYLEIWQERLLDVDFMVSSELETAHAISRITGVPAARQTDVFADGQVQMVEFDVVPGQQRGDVVGLPIRDAHVPANSKVASIIRGGRMILPRGSESIEPGDRVVIIGSPESAREWSSLMAHEKRVDDVVIVGAGQTGVAAARLLLAQGVRVRLVDSDGERARAVAEELPDARVFNASGTDPDFLERERIGQAQAAIFAMRDDTKNLYAASLARVHGVAFTIAVAHEAVSLAAFDQAGIDVAVNPRAVTAEEIVRFAHDPRTKQVAMLEGNRYEVLDVTTRESSRYIGTLFRDMPVHGALIGAIVRNGKAIFPHGDDILQVGDRVIVFTEAANVPWVVEAL